jgi:hypothetical protein
MTDKEKNDYTWQYIQENRNELVMKIMGGAAETIGEEKLTSEVCRVSDALVAFIENMAADNGGSAIVALALDLTFLRVMMGLAEVLPVPMAGAAN